MADKHTCTDCGFLALRKHFSLEIVEAPLPYRESGTPPITATHPQVEICSRVPLCYKQKRDFAKEIMRDQDRWIAKGLSPELPRAPVEIARYPDPNAAHPYIMVLVTSAEIECDGYTDYIQGLSPKEHQEMLDRQKLLDWQADREDKDRAWRSGERSRDNRWRAGEIGVVVLGVVAAIAIAFFGNRGNATNNYGVPTPTTTSIGGP